MPVLSISRAISTNCIYPTGIPRIYSSSLMPSPTVFRALRASFAIASESSVSICLPKMRQARFGRLISRPILMFSVMVKPGMSMNSWCTIPMPYSIASCGARMAAGCPPISTVPSKPPVEWMTGMPNRMFISVDLPAPFSPMSAWISPGLTARETSLSTRLPKYSLEMLSIFRTYWVSNGIPPLYHIVKTVLKPFWWLWFAKIK